MSFPLCILLNIMNVHSTQKYVLLDMHRGWEGAAAACEEKYGTTLASIHSTTDQAEAYNLCLNAESGTDTCWIGMYKVNDSAEFTWLDGSNVTFTHWAGYESSTKSTSNYGGSGSGYGGKSGNGKSGGGKYKSGKYKSNKPSNQTTGSNTVSADKSCVQIQTYKGDGKWSAENCNNAIKGIICNFVTNAPTFDPTNAPSFSPSLSPTQYPTKIDEYSKTLTAVYNLQKLTEGDFNAGVIGDVDGIIEDGYVRSKVIDIEYKSFEIVTREYEISDESYNDTDIYVDVKLFTQVNYRSENVSDALIYASQKMSFLEYVENDLQAYFANESVTFSVINITKNGGEPYKLIDSPSNIVVFALFCIVIMCVLISLSALIMNKVPSSKIDDAQWFVLIVIALQLFDFVSDINLGFEMALKLKKDSDILLFVSCIGCITFIIVPWTANLILASNIKRFVNTNVAAISYFEQNVSKFISLVIFTGSCYPSMQLLSSRMFSLESLNCGLTKYELRKLSSLKVTGSVLLENIPQMILQTVYVIHSHGIPSMNTLLAMTASILSIISALLSFIVERKQSNCLVVEYDLVMSKVSVSNQTLTDDENNKISKKRERKKELRKAVCRALKIQELQIEFGFVTMTNNGFRMHCVHYIFPNKIQTKTDYNKFVQELYSHDVASVNEAFLSHFGFDANDFMVVYRDKSDQSEVEGPSNNTLRSKAVTPRTPDKIQLSDKSTSKTGSNEGIDVVKVVTRNDIQMTGPLPRESITLPEDVNHLPTI